MTKILHHYPIAWFTKDKRALICTSWRSCRKGEFRCLQPVKPSFLNVHCNVDLEILINGDICWLQTWVEIDLLQNFPDFLGESFCFLHRLSRFSTISNFLYFFTMVIKVEKRNKKPCGYVFIPFSMLVSINISRSQIHTELF